MERYKKANEGIHAPETLKQKAVRFTPKNKCKRTGFTPHVSRKAWIGAVAAVLAVVILGGIIFWPSNGILSGSAYASSIVEAQYPDMPQLPQYDPMSSEKEHAEYQISLKKWEADVLSRMDALTSLGGETALDSFNRTVIRQFLSGSGSENAFFSPLNLFLSFAMTAELTDGNSRQQILDLLEVGDMDQLRALSSALWTANYRDDGNTTAILASSLWIRDDLPYVEETMAQLAETYYASSFAGKMGSELFNRDMQSWMNDQTGGMLEEYANGHTMDPDALLALITTLYFHAPWDDQFSNNKVVAQTFHGAAEDVETTFMQETMDYNTYYWGDRFGAVQKDFFREGSMWFILPEEGVSMDELLDDPELAEFLGGDWDSWENQTRRTIHLTVPKFDISNELDLISGLKELGVTDIFNSDLADFSPTSTFPAYMSEIKHAARLSIDEKGCTGAAYTISKIIPLSAPVSQDPITFVLDRPFLFLVESGSGQFLFTGIVNQL